jgi:hypothetical protein
MLAALLFASALPMSCSVDATSTGSVVSGKPLPVTVVVVSSGFVQKSFTLITVNDYKKAKAWVSRTMSDLEKQLAENPENEGAWALYVQLAELLDKLCDILNPPPRG